MHDAKSGQTKASRCRHYQLMECIDCPKKYGTPWMSKISYRGESRSTRRLLGSGGAGQIALPFKTQYLGSKNDINEQKEGRTDHPNETL
jgi:hypothetical protein